MTKTMDILTSADNNPSLAPSRFRGFIQGKTRKTLAWLFVAFLAFSAREYPTWPGIVLCFFGATLRFWASGYLRKDVRPAVGGPYSFVRNPLYLGTYCMALGIVLSLQTWVWFLILCVSFAVVYHYIILDEEVKLKRIFGEPYTLYCTLVPRFFPRLWPAKAQALMVVNPEMNQHAFSYELAVKNKANEAYYSFLGLVAWVVIAAYFWQNF